MSVLTSHPVAVAVVSTAVGMAIALPIAWKFSGKDRLSAALFALFAVFILGAVAISGR